MSKTSDRELTARLHRLLKQRHIRDGVNGDAWAYFTEVRNKTGAARNLRSADAVAMSLYPSRGLQVHGFEIKASRADWLRELKDPSKADEFIRFLDHWWLVTEPDVVEAGELPPTWGHLVRRGSRLVQDTAAPVLEPVPPDRAFLAGLLRSASRTAEITPEVIVDAKKAAREAERKIHQAKLDTRQEALDELQSRVRDFQLASGLSLGRWGSNDPKELGAAVKLVLSGEHHTDQIEERLRRLIGQAEKLAEQGREFLPAEAAA